MDHFIPIFPFYGLLFLFYGLFAYLDHFSRDKRGPYIRNRVYCKVVSSFKSLADVG